MTEPTSTEDDRLQEEIKLLCYLKCQAFGRRYNARKRVLRLINERFEKIHDPRRQRYYYYDRQLDTSSWQKPKLLRDHDIEDIAPTYIPDQAALMIQRQLWKVWALRRVRAMYKSVIKELDDKASGKGYYLNSKTGKTMWVLPQFMGGKLDHDRDVEEKREQLRKAREKKLKMELKAQRAAERQAAGGNSGDQVANPDDDVDDDDDDEDDDGSVGKGDDGKGGSGSENDSDESDLEEDSVVRRARRKAQRKYPR